MHPYFLSKFLAPYDSIHLVKGQFNYTFKIILKAITATVRIHTDYLLIMDIIT